MKALASLPRSSVALLGVALTGWLALFGSAKGLIVPGLCGTGAMWSAGTAPFDALLRLNPAPVLVAGWITMTAAMMLPTILPQLGHVRARSAPRAVYGPILFLGGYAAVWLLACLVLTMAVILLRLAWPAGSGALPLILLALGWQASRWKARAHRRCRRLPPLRWRGMGLASDAARFGLATGGACLLSCWPWMLLCLAGIGGLPGMVMIALLLWRERFGCDQPLTLPRLARLARRSMTQARSAIALDARRLRFIDWRDEQPRDRLCRRAGG